MRNQQTFIVVASAAAITVALFLSADQGSGLWTAAWIGLLVCMAATTWFAWASIRETSFREMSLPILFTLLLFLTGIGAARTNYSHTEQSDQIMTATMALIDESILTSVVRLSMLELYDAYNKSDGTVGFDELMRSGIGAIDSTKIEQFGTVQITESTADRIVFTARSNRSKGNDDTRMIQFTGTVTSEGVQYERQN